MSTTSVPAPAINLARRQDLFSSHIVATALKQSVLMLRPDVQWKNPVMFVVEIGAILTLLYVIQMALGTRPAPRRSAISSRSMPGCS